MADATEVPFPLKVGERVHKTVPVEGTTTLVSDGNSRWVEDGDTLYLVVNEKYIDPDESPTSG